MPHCLNHLNKHAWYYLQMGVPLVQHVSEVCGHVPRYGLRLLWVHLTGLQPLQIQDVFLRVGQLANMGEDIDRILRERMIQQELTPSIRFL